MKKMHKYFACILAIAMMLTCMAACGGEGGSSTEPEVNLVTALSMDTTSVSLRVGDTASVTVTANLKATDKTVTWTSTDDAVATVVESETAGTAIITAVSAGEVTITATANDGSGVTAECTVVVADVATVIMTVGQDGELPAEPAEGITGDISFNSDGTCVINGFYANLNAQITYQTTYEVVDGVLTFDATPVDVSVMGIDGQVGTTAVVNGDKITIVCQVVGFDTSCCEFTMDTEQVAAMGLTAGENVAVEGISVPETLTVNSGAMFDVNTMVTFAPENATVKDIVVTVNSENASTKVVYQDNANIYPLLAGTIEITVTSVDNPDASAVLTLTVEAVGRPDVLETNYFESEKTFAWALNSYTFKTDGSVEIMDVAGRLQVLGYYSLSADSSQITLYSLMDAAANAAAEVEYAGTTYNLTNQEGSELLQFDIGEVLGIPGMYIALEVEG